MTNVLNVLRHVELLLKLLLLELLLTKLLLLLHHHHLLLLLLIDEAVLNGHRSATRLDVGDVNRHVVLIRHRQRLLSTRERHRFETQSQRSTRGRVVTHNADDSRLLLVERKAIVFVNY